MALSSGMGLRRADPLPFYLSKREKRLLLKKAKWSKVSMVEFVRCRTYDYSFESVGGRAPKSEKLVRAPEEARDVPLPLYLSKTEKEKLRKLAKGATNDSMVEYARCKTFGYVFDTATAPASV